jgi:hypothetical protein
MQRKSLLAGLSHVVAAAPSKGCERGAGRLQHMLRHNLAVTATRALRIPKLLNKRRKSGYFGAPEFLYLSRAEYISIEKQQQRRPNGPANFINLRAPLF